MTIKIGYCPEKLLPYLDSVYVNRSASLSKFERSVALLIRKGFFFHGQIEFWNSNTAVPVAVESPYDTAPSQAIHMIVRGVASDSDLWLVEGISPEAVMSLVSESVTHIGSAEVQFIELASRQSKSLHFNDPATIEAPVIYWAFICSEDVEGIGGGTGDVYTWRIDTDGAVGKWRVGRLEEMVSEIDKEVNSAVKADMGAKP